MAFSGASIHCPRCKGKKEPKTLYKKVLTKHKVVHFLLPPQIPQACSAGRLQATSRERKATWQF